MPRTEDLDLTPGAPLMVTLEDVSAITLQNTGETRLRALATINDTPPDDFTAGPVLLPGIPLIGNLAEFWRTVPVGRVWIYGADGGAVYVSYS